MHSLVYIRQIHTWLHTTIKDIDDRLGNLGVSEMQGFIISPLSLLKIMLMKYSYSLRICNQICAVQMHYMIRLLPETSYFTYKPCLIASK